MDYSFRNDKSYGDVSETYSDFYDSLFGRFFLDIMSERLRDLDLEDGVRILDIGCGHGTISRRLIEDFDVAEIRGIDLSKKMVHEARQRSEDIDGSFSYSVMDFEEDLEIDEEYDLVLIQSLMCRIEDPVKVLENASKAKDDNGLVFLSYIPKKQYAFSDLRSEGVESFVRTIETSKTVDADGIKIRVFDRSEVKNYASEANLSVEAEFPLISFLNLLKSKRRRELLEQNYEVLMQKELEKSRSSSSGGLRNVLVLT